ncbi:hypothetical protein [Absidia glauca]|uniref:Uncharacterized protein n=1 Tax=Absidia glauca TaxID=4829 RepID=A0A163KRC7_ABSGL|nr:hypothetical protein [Absidia glauca]
MHSFTKCYAAITQPSSIPNSTHTHDLLKLLYDLINVDETTYCTLYLVATVVLMGNQSRKVCAFPSYCPYYRCRPTVRNSEQYPCPDSMSRVNEDCDEFDYHALLLSMELTSLLALSQICRSAG